MANNHSNRSERTEELNSSEPGNTLEIIQSIRAQIEREYSTNSNVTLDDINFDFDNPASTAMDVDQNACAVSGNSGGPDSGGGPSETPNVPFGTSLQTTTTTAATATATTTTGVFLSTATGQVGASNLPANAASSEQPSTNTSNQANIPTRIPIRPGRILLTTPQMGPSRSPRFAQISPILHITTRPTDVPHELQRGRSRVRRRPRSPHTQARRRFSDYQTRARQFHVLNSEPNRRLLRRRINRILRKIRAAQRHSRGFLRLSDAAAQSYALELLMELISIDEEISEALEILY